MLSAVQLNKELAYDENWHAWWSKMRPVSTHDFKKGRRHVEKLKLLDGGSLKFNTIPTAYNC